MCTYFGGPLGAIEHVLVPSHLPDRHDNLGVGSVPGVDDHRPKANALLVGSGGCGSRRERERERERGGREIKKWTEEEGQTERKGRGQNH